jgi:glycosyltransferase involved in cell wall biosynthesis
MKKKKRIIHVYSGTAGNAGSYLNFIYESLMCDFSQTLFVNRFYPYSNGVKVFHPITELGRCNKYLRGYFRYGVRYLELFFAYSIILCWCFFIRPDIVNFSVIGSLKLDYFFLKILSLCPGVTMIATCHDATPFQVSYARNCSVLSIREKMFATADYILVHNDYSALQLEELYGIGIKDKILKHAFPPMLVGSCSKRFNISHRFCFIGHLRIEKGVDILLKAWEQARLENFELIIAGHVPEYLGESLVLPKLENVVYHLGFVSDEKYTEFLTYSDFVILPYTKGTNSGIPSSAIFNGAIPITSDISMFIENPLLDNRFRFTSGSTAELAKVLNFCASLDPVELNQLKEKNIILLKEFEDKCMNEIKRCYSKLE